MYLFFTREIKEIVASSPGSPTQTGIMVGSPSCQLHNISMFAFQTRRVWNETWRVA